MNSAANSLLPHAPRLFRMTGRVPTIARRSARVGVSVRDGRLWKHLLVNRFHIQVALTAGVSRLQPTPCLPPV